jgi:L-fucose isomerase-like protein
MENLKVKFLMGPSSCNDRNIPAYSDQFLKELSKVLGAEVSIGEMDEVAAQPLPVYFIGSGGSEPSFKKVYEQTKEPYILLTTPAYNSLAASMEIMGFLQEKGLKGEILFGDMKKMAHRLEVLVRAAKARQKLATSHLGCFGEPGGLIASDVDFDKFHEVTGGTITMYSLQELIDEYHKGGYPENDWTKQLKEKSFNQAETEKALNVYGALRRLIDKYHLDAVTVKCFDLLGTIHTTGCLALALLNAEGIPAACEGDQKSLVSMVVLRLLSEKSGFLANPSSIDTNENSIIFAHCTLPVDMGDDYYLTTHFESGIGVALSADIAPQPMTIFKCNGDFSRYYAGRAELMETSHRKDLCRTQMKLKLLDGTEYFSTCPISNHHIIVKGDYKEVIDEFFSLYQK